MTTTTPCTLRFWAPLPPRECSANARPHWRTKARAVAAYHDAVTLCLLAGSTVRPLPAFDRAVVDLAYTFPTARRRDQDNLTIWAKPLLDALVWHRVVPDDDLAHLTIRSVTATVGREPGLWVTVEEVA